MPRFQNVSCSHCGRDFGPGDAGFSHCEDHKRPRILPDDEIDAIVTRHYRDRRHPDSYVALRETIKDAIYEDRALAQSQKEQQ